MSYRVTTRTMEEWLAVQRIRAQTRTGHVLFELDDVGLYYIWAYGTQPDQKTLDKISGRTPKAAADKFLRYFQKGNHMYDEFLPPVPKRKTKVVSKKIQVDLSRYH